METKICPKCGEEKPLTSEFWYKGKTEQYLYPCKQCRRREAKHRYKHKQSKDVTDQYVIGLLKQSGEMVNPVNIAIKRETILMKRFMEILKDKILPVGHEPVPDNKGRDKVRRNAEYRIFHPVLEKQCPNCGKLFIQRIAKQSYCCKECKSKYLNNRKHDMEHPLIEKRCIVCDNKFITRRTYKKCCSASCSYQNNLQRIKEASLQYYYLHKTEINKKRSNKIKLISQGR